MESPCRGVVGGVRSLVFVVGFLALSGTGLTAARVSAVAAGRGTNECCCDHRVDGGPRRRFAPVPLAFVARTLPPLHGIVWLGGSTYYRAAGAYYLWSPLDEEYVVVAPPSGIQFAVCDETSAGVALFNWPQSASLGRRGPGDSHASSTRLEHWTPISVDRSDNHHERHRDI
jgi:hypothetical protein